MTLSNPKHSNGRRRGNHRVSDSESSKESEIYSFSRYLQDLELYNSVKPYWCSLPPREGFDPDKERLDNLEFESRKIQIHDIRGLKNKPRISVNGFQVLNHTTKISRFVALEDVARYKSETEELLRKSLGAVYVKCYDMALRKNILFNRTEYDLNDPFHTEGPVRGAHNGMRSLTLTMNLNL
jgi:hypothetical protein